MRVIKQYAWALKILGAALLIGLALFLRFGDTGERIVVTIVGAAIILYSVIRLVPYVKTQKSDLIKTINIIEITIDVMIGIFLIVYIFVINPEMGVIFGYTVGPFLLIRGGVHFYGVSIGKEKSDFALYLFHIGALIIGSYIVFYRGSDGTPGFEAAVLLNLILLFSIVVGGYLIYDGGKGYKVYRYQKTLMMPDSDSDQPSDTVEKRIPVRPEEEERPQDSIVS